MNPERLVILADTHLPRRARDLPASVWEAVDRCDVVIHWDSTATTGLRLLNPGSPTDRRRQPTCSYLTATAEDGGLLDVVLPRLPVARS